MQGYAICHTKTGNVTPYMSNIALPLSRRIAIHIHQNNASFIPSIAQNRRDFFSRPSMLALYFSSRSVVSLWILLYIDVTSLFMLSFILVIVPDMFALNMSLLVFNSPSFFSCLLFSSFVSLVNSSLFCRIISFVKSSNLL